MRLLNGTFAISLFILVFLSFFGFAYLPHITSAVGIILFSLLYISSPPPKYKSHFTKILLFFFIFTFINMLSCYYFRQQPLWQSFRYAYIGFYIYGAYFVFRRINLPIRHIENSIYILSAIFTVCYLIQFFNPTVPLFISSEAVEQMSAVDEQVRFRFIGQAIISLGCFYSLNKYFATKKVKYVILTSFALLCIILFGFRTLLAAFIIATIILSWKYYRFSKALFIRLFVVAILAIIVFSTEWGATVLNNMMERNESSNLANTDYIRVISFNYHTTEYFKSPVEFILGSGNPVILAGEGASAYGKEVQDLQDTGFIYQDWGVIGYSWIRGIIPVLCVGWYCIKALTIAVPKEYYYIGVWMFFLLIGSITTAEIFRPGAPFLQMLALYMIDKLNHRISTGTR